jgi:hypothetical protein
MGSTPKFAKQLLFDFGCLGQPIVTLALKLQGSGQAGFAVLVASKYPVRFQPVTYFFELFIRSDG